MEMKSDHEHRPLWIAREKLVNWGSALSQEEAFMIILEAFSPLYKVATDFLIAIAEPISRPVHIHEYVLTKYSIYAAASVGLSDKDIISVLDRLSKNKKIPAPVVEFIEAHSSSYGKAKLVLRRNEYFIETTDKKIMERLRNFQCIKDAEELQRQEKRRLQDGMNSKNHISKAAMDNLNDMQQRMRLGAAGAQQP